jgi:hypothetical protein
MSTVTDPLPRAELLETINTPELTVVPPAYVLVPLKTRVPGPIIFSAVPEPVPATQLYPEGIEFELSSAIVPERDTVFPSPGAILRVAPEIAKISVPTATP